ncbi:minor tail protein [Synechococcus virus S-ESS1]|uniref:Minor tail protein n=1 Tax=Synechococcus virus S-ESS1 TaxID=1964565 RepID=A0A1V0DX02_9CAUD|nr:tail terminator [Synechococcus virus S-ESS1]ARB05694.1 minor tail protein [Synechococcus virus S-ESS1]
MSRTFQAQRARRTIECSGAGPSSARAIRSRCCPFWKSPIPLDQLPSPVDSGYNTGSWELMIQGFLEDDKANPTDPAHIALADVKKCLALESKKVSGRRAEDGPFGLGDSVLKITIGTGVVRPPDEISAKAYFWLLIVLDIAEDVTEPYAFNSAERSSPWLVTTRSDAVKSTSPASSPALRFPMVSSISGTPRSSL